MRVCDFHRPSSPSRMRFLTRVVFVAAALLPASLASQAAPLLGTWNIEWEIGRSIMNGEQRGVNAKGTIDIVASGDSLVATVKTLSRDDNQPITRPSITFGGKATATGGVFTQISEATLNMNGEERKQKSIGTWTLTVSGTTLSGEVKRSIEGLDIDIPAAPVKGTRAP